MGTEKDFLRPKNRDNRPPDELVELEADIAVDVMDAGAAGAAVEDAVVEAAILIGVSFGEGGWMEARFCAKAFLADNVDESTEPVPRPRLGLRKMLLPKLDLSRSVLLVLSRMRQAERRIWSLYFSSSRVWSSTAGLTTALPERRCQSIGIVFDAAPVMSTTMMTEQRRV